MKRAPLLIRRAHRQNGISLLVVMVLLVIASILGVAASQIALQSQRSARNDRDLQMALQAANLALQDASAEISDSNNSRRASFSINNRGAFVNICGTGSGDSRGLCLQAVEENQSDSWLTVDLTNDAATVPYGTFTKKTFTLPASGVIGVQPAKSPRYIIERIFPWQEGGVISMTKSGAPTDAAAWYRVTAMGFGPRDDIIAVTQSVIRKPAD